MMEKKYQVFISSTFHDLKEERMEIMEALINLGHIPVGMELFNASDDTQWGVIKRRIEESDYYVLILSDRYGSVDRDGIGFTEKEYDYAISIGVPVIAFVRTNEAISQLPFEDRESNHREKLDSFRKKLSTRLYKPWSDKHDLSKKFFLSFAELIREKPRIGWIRGESKNIANQEEFRSVLSENERLRQKLDKLNEELQKTTEQLNDFKNMTKVADRIIKTLEEKEFDFGGFRISGAVLVNIFSPFVASQSTVESAADAICEYIGVQTGEKPSSDFVQYIIGAFASIGMISIKSETIKLHEEDSHRGDLHKRDRIKIIDTIVPTEIFPLVYANMPKEEFSFPKKPQVSCESRMLARLGELSNFSKDAYWTDDEEKYKVRKQGKIDSILTEFIAFSEWTSHNEKQNFLNQDFMNDSKSLSDLVEKARETIKKICAQQGAPPDRYSAGVP